MKNIIAFMMLVFLLTSCTQKPNPGLLALQTQNAKLENDLNEANKEISFLKSVTPKIVLITSTPTSTPIFTPTPENTPTITFTPTNTLVPTATTDPMKLPKTDGFYLVNVDIAPGIWRSGGTEDNCYWEITSSTGGIIANHFGMSGGTMFVSQSAFQVQIEDCGLWTFLSAHSGENGHRFRLMAAS